MNVELLEVLNVLLQEHLKQPFLPHSPYFAPATGFLVSKNGKVKTNLTEALGHGTGHVLHPGVIGCRAAHKVEILSLTFL